MVKIILSGWKEGFEKVSLTMLQKEKLGMSLKDAKRMLMICWITNQ